MAKKWKYKVLDPTSGVMSRKGEEWLNKGTEARLNQLGDEGWELVAFLCNDYSGTTAIFKKEKA